jgi:hypothetical protein
VNITNGTVSRTFKPADYEARMVSLSFTLDPGDDVEACVAQGMAMAERQARGLPAHAVAHVEPIKQPRRPPAVVLAPAPEPAAADPIAPVAQESGAVTIVGSAVQKEEGVADTSTVSLVTDAVLDAAVKKARAGNIAPDQIKAAILTFTEQPGVSMKSLDQDKRVLLVAAIEELKPLAHADA